jgi:ribosomal protein S18 acetylase RimI-like enzyme
LTKSSNSIRVSESNALVFAGDNGRQGLFNANALAMANRLEGHVPFAIEVNGNLYLAYRRHASAVVGGLSLGDMVTLLEDIPKVRLILRPMGIKNLSLNTLNAVNNPDALATAIKLNCDIRFEFLLDITQYSMAKISSNHKRNIKKSVKAGAKTAIPTDIEAMRSHIEMVNRNLGIKGLGGISNSPEYFRHLIEKNAGLLMQVWVEEELLASTFFIKNQDYAYYHSSGTSDHGKHIGAAHFLVDRMIDEMRERQMRYLNFGGCTSEQTGLYRFKMGFRPETRVLASKSHRLIHTGKQRIRSFLSTKPEEILRVNRVKVYTKSLSNSPRVDLEDHSLEKVSFGELLDAVSIAPELSRCLEIYCRHNPYCYALFSKQEQIVAVGFIETADINRKSTTKKHSFSPDVAEITHLQVVENMRAKGVGRHLVALLEHEVSNMGINKACSRVPLKNIASQKMFESAGFQLAGEEKMVSTALMGGGSLTIDRIGV